MKILMATVCLLPIATAVFCLAQVKAVSGPVISDDFVEYMMRAYNPHDLGLKDDRYYPYQTPFGGRRIGFRSVIRDKALYRQGLSTQEAQALLREDLKQTQSELEAHLKSKHAGKPLDRLSRFSQEILLDFAYSEGAASLKSDLVRAVIDQNWNKMIDEMLYVRSLHGSPNSTLNRAFADRWIYSGVLRPVKPGPKPSNKPPREVD